MAEIPSWLNYAPLGSNFSGQQLGTTLLDNALAQRQLEQQALEASQRMAIAQQEAQMQAQRLAQDAMLAQLEASGQQAQLGMRGQELAQLAADNRAKFSLAEAEDRSRAQRDAIQFQGYQALQSDLAQGVPLREAYLKNIGALSFGQPSVLGQVVDQGRQLTPPTFAADAIGKPQPIPGLPDFFIPTGPNAGQIVRDPQYVNPRDQSLIDQRAAALDPSVRAWMQVELQSLSQNPSYMFDADARQAASLDILTKAEELDAKKKGGGGQISSPQLRWDPVKGEWISKAGTVTP